MIYRTDGMVLSRVRDVFTGPVNDIAICQDIQSTLGTYYTLLIIKDRACAKRVLAVFENTERSLAEGETPYLSRFSDNELLLFVFEYRPERRLSAFAEGQMSSRHTREETSVNIVMECLSNPMPYPLLYLMLTQDNLHIEKDNSVFLTPYIDLSQLDEEMGERECASCCARIILQLLEGSSGKKLKSFELIWKKEEKSAYNSFPELYRDIKLTAEPLKKKTLRQRLRAMWLRNRDWLFRVLLVICVIVVILTIIFLISQIIFGDIPLLRIFEHSFDVIGTQSLKR